jgi:hypothetical protein
LRATILRCSIAIAKGRFQRIGHEDTGRAGLEWRKKHNFLGRWPIERQFSTSLWRVIKACNQFACVALQHNKRQQGEIT